MGKRAWLARFLTHELSLSARRYLTEMSENACERFELGVFIAAVLVRIAAHVEAERAFPPDELLPMRGTGIPDGLEEPIAYERLAPLRYVAQAIWKHGFDQSAVQGERVALTGEILGKSIDRRGALVLHVTVVGEAETHARPGIPVVLAPVP